MATADQDLLTQLEVAGSVAQEQGRQRGARTCRVPGLRPAGPQLACLLEVVLHYWDDERAVAILKHRQRALAGGGRLLVLEAVVPQAAARPGWGSST